MKKLVEKDKKGRGGTGPDYIGEMETTGFQWVDPEPLANRTC